MATEGIVRFYYAIRYMPPSLRRRRFRLYPNWLNLSGANFYTGHARRKDKNTEKIEKALAAFLRFLSRVWLRPSLVVVAANGMAGIAGIACRIDSASSAC